MAPKNNNALTVDAASKPLSPRQQKDMDNDVALMVKAASVMSEGDGIAHVKTQSISIFEQHHGSLSVLESELSELVQERDDLKKQRDELIKALRKYSDAPSEPEQDDSTGGDDE